MKQTENQKTKIEKPLLECRNEIDLIDKQMAILFEKRMEIVLEIAKYKAENGLEIFDSAREKAVLEKNLNLINNPSYKKYYEKFMRDLMEISKELQHSFLDK